MKRINIFYLTLIFLIAFALRIWYLPQNAVSFAYDQARDAFTVKEILSGDFKILGPSVSGVPGLYHGVFYYYVIAIGYLFSGGSPLGASYLFSFISSLVVIVIYYFSFTLTRKTLPSILSALFYAVSFEATQYANLLTNASMGVWFIPMTYLGLFLWLKKLSKWGSILAGISFGLSIQSEFALGYHVVPILIWIFYSRKTLARQETIKFIASLFFALLPMIISELKFGFKGASGLVYLLTNQDTISKQLEFGQFVTVYLNQLGKTLAYTIFPINIALGGLIGFFLLFNTLKRGSSGKSFFTPQNFLVLVVVSHIFALPFGGSNMKHILVGQVGIICVLLGIFIWENFKDNKLLMSLVLAVIVIANLMKITGENINGQTIFPLQPDLFLANEIKLVDYTYNSAGGEKFSINSLTSPLYVNTLWSYLYNWYGKKTYGFLPFWSGKDQLGQPGNNLALTPKTEKLHYYIIEPTYGIPEYFVRNSLADEDSRSVLLEEKHFGELKVQKRLLNN